ncbi:MAG: 7TM-DISM domain-containing protein [Gammaproteobacteria bacterium]|nr:7TM-DISM domain-containing protein [Gammaproteobacteria bacterium]
MLLCWLTSVGHAAIPVLDVAQAGRLPITLDGPWLFIPQAFVVNAPEQPLPASVLASAQPFQVPGLWNRDQAQRAATPVQGYGTFLLDLHVPPGERPYVLKLPDMPSAWRLWVNGRVLAVQGVPGTQASEEQPAFGPRSVQVDAQDGVLRLALQVSNFHYKEGGIWHSLYLADPATRAQVQDLPMVRDALVVGLLVAIGLYHLVVFGVRRQERAALAFGLFTLGVGLRTGLVGERIFYPLIDVGWATWQRLEHVLFFVSLPLFVAYFRYLFEQETPRLLVRLSVVAAAVGVVASLTLPVAGFTRLNTPYQGVILLACLCMLVSYARAWRARRTGVRLFGGSLILLVLAIIHDVLLAQLWIQSVPMVSFGLIGFLVAQAILLNQRYADSLQRIEEMSVELQRRNAELEQLNRFKDAHLAQEVERRCKAEQALAREPLVALMRMSLDLWEQHTGTSRVALAEASGCWKVYDDAGTRKTRTLDRYLSLRTLPDNPRWRNVVRTANVVKARCTLTPDERQALDQLMKEVSGN